MNWRAIVRSAGGVLEGVASSFGPFPLLVVSFAVEVVELAIDAVEAGRDPVATAQAIADKAVDLIEKVKVGGA